MRRITKEEAIALYNSNRDTVFIYTIDSKLCAGEIIGTLSIHGDLVFRNPYDTSDYGGYINISHVDYIFI